MRSMFVGRSMTLGTLCSCSCCYRTVRLSQSVTVPVQCHVWRCRRTAVKRLILDNLQPVMRGVKDWVSDAYRRHVVYSEEIDTVPTRAQPVHTCVLAGLHIDAVRRDAQLLKQNAEALAFVLVRGTNKKVRRSGCRARTHSGTHRFQTISLYCPQDRVDTDVQRTEALQSPPPPPP